MLLDQAKEELPGAFQELMQRLLGHLKELDRQVREIGPVNENAVGSKR
jgi:transposase